MSVYALVSNNTVVNVIVASANEVARLEVEEAIEIDPNNPIGIGWVKNVETGVFYNPNELEPTE